MVLTVEIEDRRIKKPWLGGFRQRISGVIQSNAASQTTPLTKSNIENQCSRTVQSKETRNVSLQQCANVATQMWRSDCYIPCNNDTYMTAKSYESFGDREMRLDLDGHARIIQKCYRAYKMLKNIKACTQAYRKIVEDCQKFENEKADLHRQRHQLEIARQTFPQVRSDFEKIYGLIESWKLSRINLINKRLFSFSGKAEHYRTLETTVEMLKDVEEHRNCIAAEYSRKRTENFLDFHCKSVKWTGYKGKPVEMVTLRVQKAREYKKLYNDLSSVEFTFEERLGILIMLKKILESHNCIPSRELESLVDQEIMLSSRKINMFFLKNLKKRILLAFLCFINLSHDCCSDNRFQDMELSEPVDRGKRLCQSCSKLLALNRFKVHERMKKLNCCFGCVWLRQRSIEKEDNDPYLYLLNGIRADEHKRNCFSSLLYVIQEPGIHHLVKNIWHGRSIVSEIDDIFRLRLIRFHVNQEWAPWNCILLTEDESEAHYYIEDLSKVYSKVLLDRIYLAHEIARSHFKELIRFDEEFRASEHYKFIQTI